MIDFISFALANGVLIERLEPDCNRIRRCATVDHPKSKNGAFFFDGVRGWVMSWEISDKVSWWNSDKKSEWTEADKRAWAQKRRAAETSKDLARANASNHAATLIKQAQRATHPYLIEKGHPDALGLTLDDALLVPMRDAQNDKLLGVQTIRLVDNSWNKKMLSGMRAKGAVFVLGNRKARQSILVEGFATALSVEAAVRMMRIDAAVVCCFSSSNLVHVAPMFPRSIIFADNDESGTGERAAKQAEKPYCMSDVIGEDANDLHVREGIMSVVKKISEAMRKL